jgi:hypothetical protein
LIAGVVARLKEARGISLLRALNAEANVGRVSRVGEQVLAAGKQVLGNLFAPKR